ncbi:glycine zipper family protein [Candidatus Poribacteria bacterium]|nr:glycine zipper family protein [Candidatus Poribacteria bacterium]
MVAQYESRRKNTLSIVTPATLKRAALLFDKVCLIVLPTEVDDDELDIAQVNVKKLDWLIQRLDLKLNPGYQISNQHDAVTVLGSFGKVAEALYKTDDTYADYDLIPVYKRESDLDSDFPSGPTVAYQAAINSLPQAQERKLSLQQIANYRNDPDSVRKYRALRTWLPEALAARSVPEAEDKLAKMIEDYKSVLRKHSIDTAKGSIELLCSSASLVKSIPATVGGLLGGAVIGGPLGGAVGAALSAGMLLGGQIVVHVKERRLNLDEKLRNNSLEAAAVISELRDL